MTMKDMAKIEQLSKVEQPVPKLQPWKFDVDFIAFQTANNLVQ